MWVDSFTIELEGVRMSVRSNRATTLDALRDALASYVVDDPEAPPNFSVRISNATSHTHVLYWGGCVAAKSYDPDRLARALLDHLELQLAPPDGVITVQSLAYVGPDGAVLVPYPLQDQLLARDRRFRDAGFVAVDAPRSFVDPDTAELIVPERLDVDRVALAHAVDGVVRRRPEPPVAPGRYPIDRWLFMDYTGKYGRLSRAAAGRAVALQLLSDARNLDADKLRRFAGIFESARGYGMELGFRGAIFKSVTTQGRDE